MNKYFLISLLAVSLLVSSCEISPKNITQAIDSGVKSATSGVTGAGLLSDAARLKKAQDELKALPKLAGKDIKVFQNILFSDNGTITIAIQDPTKPANVDEYNYAMGKWSDPQPVQIEMDAGAKMEDNVYPLSTLDFQTVAKIADNWKKLAANVEGAKPLNTIMYNFFVPTQTKSWYAEPIAGTREKKNIKVDLDGTVTLEK